VSTVEQVSISFRHVEKDLSIEETFMGFYSTSSTTGETLASIIKDSMIRFNLEGKNLRGQAYDGASNMSGKHAGVQAILKKDFPRAMYIHCWNHCLNLALQDITKGCTWIRDALGLVHGVFTFFKDSPKRKEALKELQDGLASLKPISPTRWTVRHASLQAFQMQYSAIMQALSKFASDKQNSTAAATASGYASQMSKMEEYFAVCLAKAMFFMTDKVATLLQSPHITMFDAIKHVNTLKESLLDLKKDCFELTWNEATRFAEKHQLTLPKQPRPAVLPLRYRDASSKNCEFSVQLWG